MLTFLADHLAQILGACCGMLFGAWMLTAWRLRRMRRSTRSRCVLAANTLPLGRADRRALSARFMLVLRGVPTR